MATTRLNRRVISSAGYSLFGTAGELSDAEMENIIADSGFDTTDSRRCLRYAQTGRRRIINIFSYGGQGAYPSKFRYAAPRNSGWKVFARRWRRSGKIQRRHDRCGAVRGHSSVTKAHTSRT